MLYPLPPLSNHFVTIIVHKHVLKVMKFGENKKVGRAMEVSKERWWWSIDLANYSKG